MRIRRKQSPFVNHISHPRVARQPDGFRHGERVILHHFTNIPGADVTVHVRRVIRLGVGAEMTLAGCRPIRWMSNRVDGVNLDEQLGKGRDGLPRATNIVRIGDRAR